ncbi:MAG TPA: hypothetical protein VGH33_12175 [Isosphaeraceae bacterium]
MRSVQSSPQRDPEFDHPPRPVERKPPPDEVGFYQRLVVNPFLAIVTVLLFIGASHALGDVSRARLIPRAAVLGSLAAALALQYHCLDCGTTGSYHRWRRHACARVVERWRTPYSAASHLFPSPGTQLVLWILLIVFGSFFWLLGYIE